MRAHLALQLEDPVLRGVLADRHLERTHNRSDGRGEDRVLDRGGQLRAALALDVIERLARPLEVADWQKIVDQYKKTPNKYNIAYMEVYGAAIGRPAEPNAFIHRDVYMDFYIDAFWQRNTRFTDQKASRAWIDGYLAALAPYLDGHKYQNYPVRNLPDFRWAYWGDAFPTLLQVKQKYDPGNFFRFEQSISPYPGGDGITRSSAAPLFGDEPIVALG